MIKKRLRILKKNFKVLGIDGYVIPKNDEFFSEYSKVDRLKFFYDDKNGFQKVKTVFEIFNIPF